MVCPFAETKDQLVLSLVFIIINFCATKERYSTGCLKVVSFVFIIIHFCATKERYSTGCLNVVSLVFIIIHFCDERKVLHRVSEGSIPCVHYHTLL